MEYSVGFPWGMGVEFTPMGGMCIAIGEMIQKCFS